MNVLDCILLQCDQKFYFPALNKSVACKISSRSIDIRDQQGKLTVLECIFESSARQAHGAALKMAGSLRGDLSLFRASAVFSVHFSTLFRATSQKHGHRCMQKDGHRFRVENNVLLTYFWTGAVQERF